jgi:hypothetical protein
MAPRPSSKGSRDALGWPNWFAMITRGFVEEYSLELKRNEWALYLALATFYNLPQRRSFPTLQMLEQLVPIDRYGRSRALKRLTALGLVEVWSERWEGEGARFTDSYTQTRRESTWRHRSSPQRNNCATSPARVVCPRATNGSTRPIEKGVERLGCGKFTTTGKGAQPETPYRASIAIDRATFVHPPTLLTNGQQVCSCVARNATIPGDI